MSAGIVFHFENFNTDVFSGRQIDLDCWRYACKAFDISKMRMIDVRPDKSNKVNMTDKSMDFEIHKTIEEFEEVNSGDSFIYLETPWDFEETGLTDYVQKLTDFEHPSEGNVWYIFGPANGFAPERNDGRTWVTIPQVGRGAMHAVHVIPVVLADRYFKINGLI